MSETTDSFVRTRRFGRTGTFVLAGLMALLVSLSIAISVGAVPVPPSTVWGVLLNKCRPT